MSTSTVDTPSTNSNTKKASSLTSTSQRIASFVVTAFVAYSLVLFASGVPAVNGESTGVNNNNNNEGSGGDGGDDKKGLLFKEEKMKDDNFGYEYVGFDTYPGIHLDDGTGVATAEVKAASIKVIDEALEAAGLGGGTSEHITLHPLHIHRSECPSYGCPFLPLDVHYEEEAKAQLEAMRKLASEDEKNRSSKVEDDGKFHFIRSSGSKNAAALTLIGYKGGRLEDQVNQDRALVLSPYLYWNINNSSGRSDTAKPVARLLGAFDGHARFGEKVSEYVAKTLPALLGRKLVEHATKDESDTEQANDHKIATLLRDTFLELDATSPADPSGGCTASIILQLGSKIYVANAGDSRSFIGVHIVPPNDPTKANTALIYGTREDKAHLPKERERVEHMGGTVFLPRGFLATGQGTTRVYYKDPTTGGTSGLAMSRSIGDWDAGHVGVIPDPLVAILDINDIRAKVLKKLNGADGTCSAKEIEVDPASREATEQDSQCVKYTEKDIKVFAISATDGLLDYVPEETIAKHVAKGLYNSTAAGETETEDGVHTAHPLTACEDLIYAAAQGWQEDKQGRYRDDIAIAITDLD